LGHVNTVSTIRASPNYSNLGTYIARSGTMTITAPQFQNTARESLACAKAELAANDPHRLLYATLGVLAYSPGDI
jgi:hypothetical protein